jgi:hypothetical protein
VIGVAARCVPAPTSCSTGFASGTVTTRRRPMANAQMPITSVTAPPTITVQMMGANDTVVRVS